MNDRQKDEKVRQMNTEALRKVVASEKARQAPPATPSQPLGGIVHLSGIGQVPVSKLRAELARREAAA
jgi:hypothetical protein